MSSNYGSLLREWRKLRRFSQLELSLESGTSARHISFLESGRATPSREMVLSLAQTLELPFAATNNALMAAGFAPVYPSLAANDERLLAVNQAMAVMLDNHDPFPAIVFDQNWVLKKFNRCAACLFGAFGVQIGDNLLQTIIDLADEDSPLQNWQEVADLIALRLRTEISQAGSNPVLERSLEKLNELRARSTPSVTELTARQLGDAHEAKAVIPLQLQVGDNQLRLFSMIAQFGSVQEIALAELRIELYFPQDAASRELLQNLPISD